MILTVPTSLPETFSQIQNSQKLTLLNLFHNFLKVQHISPFVFSLREALKLLGIVVTVIIFSDRYGSERQTGLTEHDERTSINLSLKFDCVVEPSVADTDVHTRLT